jgi:outer membrane protein TolC
MSRLIVWLSRTIIPVFVIVFAIPSANRVLAQQPVHLTIEEAYSLARKNYPLIKQRDLITKTREYTVSNAAKGHLPVLMINGQATYQSAVTTIPFNIPGITIPPFNKDQYNIHGEVDEVIYDGGVIKNQKQTAEANEGIQQQNLEVQLYALYDRINQIFLGAILIGEQLRQNGLVKKDIQNGIDKAKALVANGTAYRSSVDELQAQILQTEQSRIELKATRRAYLDMLGVFVNMRLDSNTVLERPVPLVLADAVTRPELLYYEYQKRTYDLQDDLLKTQLRPKFNFYVQGGYARPGLNFLSNDFSWYYIGGVKLNWNLGSLYTLKNQRQLTDINRTMLDLQKETFLFNTQITRQQQNEDVEKYLELLKTDNAIIVLRESVKNAAAAQMENGVLSAHDFVTQVNSEDEARQNLILHELQLLQAQYNYQTTMGNIKIQ